MAVVAVIQARMGSRRLPGKVLADLGGMPVLEWVVRASSAIPEVHVAMVATSVAAADDEIDAWCRERGVSVYRGSEDDVLDRFRGAAAAAGADVVVRVTADCPLLDPAEAAKVLVPVTSGAAEYASNNDPPTYPDGLDCEAFTFGALEQAAARARRPSEREHVTPYIRDPANRFRVARVHSGRADLARHRWTLDTPEDLVFLRSVAAALPAERPPRMAEVLAVLERRPELLPLNAGIRRNEGYARSLARDRREGF